jgi:hypothetical protein
MKKVVIMLVILFGIGCQSGAFAQHHRRSEIVRLQGDQPDWGPYSYSTATFYYFPEMNLYYDIANALFYYLTDGRWISANQLPPRYRDVDLYSVYKVPLRGSERPWFQNAIHKQKYASYKDRDQSTYRDQLNNMSGNNRNGNMSQRRQNNNDDRGNYNQRSDNQNGNAQRGDNQRNRQRDNNQRQDNRRN